MPTVSAASTTTTEGFGVAVTREDTTWRCSLLAPELLDDLDGVITGLRRVATAGPVFGLLAVRALANRKRVGRQNERVMVR